MRRRRIAVVSLVVAIAAAATAFVAQRDDQAGPRAMPLVPRTDPLGAGDPLAYDESQDEALSRAAAFGLSRPLFAKSPGGVNASARRTASFRPLVERAVAGTGVSTEMLEAVVFLESAGRPDVIAGDDPERASGLTQILAETATNFLGMKVDLAKSRNLTRAIAAAVRRGDAASVARLQERRRSIDARFDPAEALAGTVRYLTIAHERLGRADLALVSYHMGIGNLVRVLRAYANAPTGPIPALVRDERLSWVSVYFDTAPDRNIAAHRLLARLGDDSPTYYWRLLAAAEIMRLHRDDPARLAELDNLHKAKASAEEVLHPATTTTRFADPSDLERAWRTHLLQALPDDPRGLWVTVDPEMGELASRLDQPQALYRGLRAEALAALVYIGARVYALSGVPSPLEVTSTVRDESYQRLLRAGNPEATRNYSLHTTGFAFDIRRRYGSDAQAQAFQFVLDDLRDRGLIAWVREPAAIHITVSSEASVLVRAMLEAAEEQVGGPG